MTLRRKLSRSTMTLILECVSFYHPGLITLGVEQR